MNCKLPYDQVIQGLSPLTSQGSTSELHVSNDTQYVVKRVTKYVEYGLFAREVCLLDKLQQFGWSSKLFCVGADYFVTKHIGVPLTSSCINYPQNYTAQVDRIVHDMESVGIRHNDMLKDESSDIVIDSNKMVHLIDFGWGTLNNSLKLKCKLNGRIFESPATHPNSHILEKGLANTNERYHTNPCRSAPFQVFRQRNGQGSQKEIPSISVSPNRVIVTGYQHFRFTSTGLHFHGHPKYMYLQKHLTALTRPCVNVCRFLDIGSNTGLVSFIAERTGFSHIMALDHDAPAIDVLQKAVKAVDSKVQGRVFSFGDTLPKADVAFCGALIHWVFCLTADFKGDFSRIVQYLATNIEHYLIIEWVNNNDPAIQSFRHIQRCGHDQVQKYSKHAFINALQTVGQITHETAFGTRMLFTLRLNRSRSAA